MKIYQKRNRKDASIRGYMRVLLRQGILTCLLAGIGFFCSSCSTPIFYEDLDSKPWNRSEILLMDDVDESIAPDQDIIALYSREVQDNYQIRIDFLGLDDYYSSTTLIALDIRPGGTTKLPFNMISDLDWDFLIIIPPNSPGYIINDQGNRIPQGSVQTKFDLEQDTLIIQLQSGILPGNPSRFRIQALVQCSSGNSDACDKTRPSLPSEINNKNARVSFVFWDNLPAATPEQLLRRWDGAHTGPFGQRHGLKHLLDFSQAYKVPLFLEGFNNPQSRLGLILVNQLTRTESLIHHGLIRISSVNDAPRTGLSLSEEEQIDREGLTTQAKKILAKTAAQSLADIIFFGGSLPKSGWGDSSIGKRSFEYIYNHPWIIPIFHDNHNFTGKELSEGRAPLNWLTQIRFLIWSFIPYNFSGCDLPSIDPPALCTLTNSNFFVVINTVSGYPEFLSSKDVSSTAYTWINPRQIDSQAAKSLLPAISTNPLSVNVHPGHIDLINLKENVLIDYSLVSRQLQIHYVYKIPKTIAVLLTPRIIVPVANSFQVSARNTSITFTNELPHCKLLLESGKDLQYFDPERARALLLKPENPDIAYPRDFQVPFGSVLVEITDARDLTLNFKLVCTE